MHRLTGNIEEANRGDQEREKTRNFKVKNKLRMTMCMSDVKEYSILHRTIDAWNILKVIAAVTY